MVKSRIYAFTAACLLSAVLCGCGGPQAETAGPAPIETSAQPTVPATIPADGNPSDVTCKGSYTGTDNRHAMAAKVGDAVLTNDLLQGYYWAEVASYQASGETPAPDFSKPLDTQACEADSSVNSWQQYFLRRALNTWHSAQALIQQGNVEGLPVEEAYEPNLKNYDTYMTGMPATKYLYRYQKAFQPNTMHQTWLDAIPEMLDSLAADQGYADAAALAERAFGATEEGLQAFVESYNRGYMYYTNLSYFITPSAEEVESWFVNNESAYQALGITKDSGKLADIRHILLLPSSLSAEESATGSAQEVTVNPDGTVTAPEERWEACMAEAEALLSKWHKDAHRSEGSFAERANELSQDKGSALNGGGYRNLRQGQLLPELDAWVFHAERESGDTTILRSPYGVHILYYSSGTDLWYQQAEWDLIASQQADLLTLAREAYPMEVDYSAIVLSEAEATVSLSDLLYADIAHERFPEIPLYLQQDYPSVYFGGDKIATNGCGITTFAMVATYMSDEEHTPPEMSKQFSRYGSSAGTDGFIFDRESANLGFYVRKKSYDHREARAALEEGQVVVAIQHVGYWTRAGHYIAVEKLLDDTYVQVRDSNIYNYGRIHTHKEDRHTWGNVIANGTGYWIFEDKVTYIPACSRCGEGKSSAYSILTEDYLCEKCVPALLRRGTYLDACGST